VHESESLAQDTIIENLDPAEAARLSKVRNIGIAVSYPCRIILIYIMEVPNSG